MGTRLELHEMLCDILGSRNVYFQPPESIKMKYPCIVYELDTINGPHANNHRYLKRKRYALKYISRDPDNTMVDILLDLPYCRFDRRFVIDNLYHDCFDLYF